MINWLDVWLVLTVAALLVILVVIVTNNRPGSEKPLNTRTECTCLGPERCGFHDGMWP